jgi:hypothetical protein
MIAVAWPNRAMGYNITMRSATFARPMSCVTTMLGLDDAGACSKSIGDHVAHDGLKTVVGSS